MGFEFDQRGKLECEWRGGFEGRVVVRVEGEVGEEKRVVIKKQERLVRGKRNTKVVSFECFTTFEALYVFMQVFFYLGFS
jgi:hypothetical protein